MVAGSFTVAPEREALWCAAGLNKAETAAKYGDEQVFDLAPLV